MGARYRSRKQTPQDKKDRTVLCAIYTRKSTDEGLDSDFSSLDSQREYCQAFIKSREPEGWRACGEDYPDPGFSGGNMERPGLKKLVADARKGKFNVVVCYKYDRLSRNTKDFLQILEVFDQAGIAFVSVTQPIDTTSSVGRLMRSILMDFSQFEREMISERTRDKLAAMAKKGKRTGGHPILGYDIDPENKALVVNKEEAAQVLDMFRTYLKTKSLSATAKALREKGISMKRWTAKNGKRRGGRALNKATVFNLLRNPLYVGRIVHRGEEYPGAHKAIVPKELFAEVRHLLSRNGHGRIHRSGFDVKHNFLLRGLLRCAACGTAMTPYACYNRLKKRFFYYKCIAVNKLDKTVCKVRSVPAKAIEDHVIRRMSILSTKRALLEKVMEKARGMAGQELPTRRAERQRQVAALARVQAELKNLMGHMAQESPDSPRRAKFLGEIDQWMAQEKEIQERLARLDKLILELEKRNIDADVVQRNLGNFLKVFERLSDSDQRELLSLLIARIVYDKESSRLTIALNPLPDLWGDTNSLESVLVQRKTSLRMLDGLQTPKTQINGVFGEKKPPIASFWMPDDSEFRVVLAHRGRRRLAFPEEAAAVDRRKVPRPPRPPRVQILLKRAYELKERLDGRPRLTRDALAKEEGIDPSQLTRILHLLNLAPEIREFIERMPPQIVRGPVTERRLRPIAMIREHTMQLQEFTRLLREPARKSAGLQNHPKGIGVL